MTRPLLEIRGVHKRFGSVEVLRDVTLEVRPGEVTCIIGPSGSGKSTLLRTINQLEEVDRGCVYLDGELIGYQVRGQRLVSLRERELARQRTQIGMVFQDFNLFPHMTVLDNVIEAPVGVLGQSRGEAKAYAHELLSRVGLSDKQDVYPRHLSGGQQQRVAIARALAMRPKLVLFDEPTSALDPELVGDVLAVMKDLAQAGLTMLIVTHEIAFAREVADTVIFMDGGRIVEAGTAAAVIEAPNHERTRVFLARVGHPGQRGAQST